MSLGMAERRCTTVFFCPRGTSHQEAHVEESATVSHQAESRPPFFPTALSLRILERPLQAVSSISILGLIATDQSIGHITYDLIDPRKISSGKNEKMPKK